MDLAAKRRKHADYMRLWYHKNKDKVAGYKAAHPEWKVANREYMRHRPDKFKNYYNNRVFSLEYLGGKCQVCGNSDHRVLQFDHIDPTSKIAKVTTFFNRKNRTLLIEELKKCQLLCANCHAIKTYEEGTLKIGRPRIAA